jgi:hypothetical protein
LRLRELQVLLRVFRMPKAKPSASAFSSADLSFEAKHWLAAGQLTTSFQTL